MIDKVKAKFFRSVLGNIVICATVAALLLVTVSSRPTAADEQAVEPIYAGNSERAVSLMVNVYWGAEYIDPMLDIFSRYGARTTFFVGGSWAVKYPQTLKRICAAGHEIGNHGYYHKDHSKLDAAYNKKEISDAHAAVLDITGREMTLFAPPSGAYGKAAVAAACELGYRTVLWTRDTIDWRDGDSELIFRRAVKDLKGGDLILIHPTAATVAALDRIVAAIYAAGLAVAPVSETIGT